MKSVASASKESTQRGTRLYLRATGLVCLIIGFLLAGLQYQALTLPKSEALNLQQADALIVATGGQARISAGLNLMERKLADRMLVTGVGDGITKTELIRSLALSDAQAIQLTCCVDLDFTAADTAGNAIATARWMEANQFQSLILVTANYHLARAQLEFERHMPKLDIQYFAVVPPELNADTWYRSWQVARLLLRETGKYLATHLRHFTTALPATDQNPA